MIRLTPWGEVASELAGRPRAGSGARVLRRLAAQTHSAWFWAGLWTAALAAGAGALYPAVYDTQPWITGAEVVFRLAGISFAVCGLIAWRRRPDSDVGRLMAVAGFAVFVYPLTSQIDAALALTLGTLFASVWTVAFAALILSFVTGGRLESRVDRAIVGTIFVALFILQFARMLFVDYPGNLLVVRGDMSVADTIGDVQYILCIAASLGAVAVIAARWREASSPRRRALLPSVAGCLSALLFSAMLFSQLVWNTIPAWLGWVTNAALLTVPAAFLAGLLRSRLARGGLAELFRELGGLRGERLQAGLARSLGDPGLVLAYHQPEAYRYVDVHGEPIALPAPGSGRAVAPAVRDGRELGALVYDASLDDDPEMVQAVAAGAAIALDNERLHAESAASLNELRASRERIVAAGDAERRRLERNLHDGAQQRLVALGMQLGMIKHRLHEDPELAAELVTAAGEQVSHSLEELRELARGIHPAVLDHGLSAALDSLASRSPVPTTLAYECEEGLPEQVELAAYFVASEALANVAKYARATRATVRMSRRGDRVAIEIADDGVGGADESAGSGLRGLADRVGALDGTLRISSPEGAGTVVTAEFPLGR